MVAATDGSSPSLMSSGLLVSFFVMLVAFSNQDEKKRSKPWPARCETRLAYSRAYAIRASWKATDCRPVPKSRTQQTSDPRTIRHADAG